MPEEDEDDTGGQIGRMYTRIEKLKGMSKEEQIKEDGDIAKDYLAGVFEYQGSRREPQAANFLPELLKLIDKKLNPEQFWKEFFALPQDELNQFGISPEAVREAESGITLSKDVVAKMTVEIADFKKRDDLKDFIKELEKKLTDTEADNFILEVPLKEEIKELEAEIKELDDTIGTKDKKITELDNGLESQLSKFKRLLKDVLKNPDSPIPLKERSGLLFKAFGVTIASIIAAVTMIFTTIGLSISNALSGSSGGSKPKPDPKPDPNPDPSITDKIKEGLNEFAEWLMNLAGKSAAALPGIIGSIVSFLIKTIGSVVGFMAEHLLIILFVVVSSIIYGLIEGVKGIGRGRESKASIEKRSKASIKKRSRKPRN